MMPPMVLTARAKRQKESGGELHFFLSGRPKRLKLIPALNLLLFGALATASAVHVDIYATAHGRLGQFGAAKSVQSFEDGIVRSIHVTNGSHVRRGTVLAQLDPTDSLTQEVATEIKLRTLEGNILRDQDLLQATTDDGELLARPHGPAPHLPLSIPGDNVYAAELHSLKAQLETFDSNLQSANAQTISIANSISSQKHVVKILQGRAAMWRLALADGVASKLDLMSAEEAAYTGTVTLGSLQSQLLSIAAQDTDLRRRKLQTIATLRAQYANDLAKATMERDELEQTLNKTTADVRHTRIVAPIDGTVEALQLIAAGQVVSRGQTVLVIVPDNLQGVVEALVQNRDIGFVRPGQATIIRFDAFPAGIYGTAVGTVVRVAKDAVNDQLSALSGDASIGSTPLSAGFNPQSLVFPVTVALTGNFRLSGGKRIPLVEGMTATLQIRTGQRRVIDYILGPLDAALFESGHER